ncbi:ABC transporter ATP-binding protein [Virgibacillus halodenitrificans]|uniref:ABC transporter ATP-binding protein n=1 Tax=Virgibacillus halodenitrificans TaxID=1482 RepID=UPI00045CC543|nr:dipeptide ABC transporter ATP-binding protein [Virgibacillus halodenitrificans]CDQ31279.1 Stage 0 sporulation protein KE [Virgibacillus halodenitrificans]
MAQETSQKINLPSKQDLNMFHHKQASSASEVIKVTNIKKYFPIKGGLLRRPVGHVKAVDDVSFAVNRGETLGLVGESGCGKSTLGRVLVRLLDATSGEISFKGETITNLSPRKMRSFRKSIQMIFQDPFGSLNTKMSIRQLIEEPLIVQTDLSKAERKEKVESMIQKVGLRISDLQKYPHEFSGGQRQRIGIARALIMNPEIVVCDEAVSALDVSIQAQVLNLMKDLQEELDLTYVFISHDLNVVHHMSDRVAVMYLGRIVEMSSNEDIYARPLHPYTQSLLQAIPTVSETENDRQVTITGDVPNPANPPSGCAFRTRCPFASEICSQKRPELQEVESGHFVACHLYNKDFNEKTTK